jgi:hypothetical protein
MYEVYVHEPSEATSHSSHTIYMTPKTKLRTPQPYDDSSESSSSYYHSSSPSSSTLSTKIMTQVSVKMHLKRAPVAAAKMFPRTPSQDGQERRAKTSPSLS